MPFCYKDKIQQLNLINCEHDAITKFTFIFSLSPCIIPRNAMHTFRVQAKGIQLNFDTSGLSMHVSDKPDSKVLSY